MKLGGNISASIHPAKHAISKKLMLTTYFKLLEIMIHKMIETSKKKNNMGSRKFELQQKKEGEESPEMMEKANSRITGGREA